MRLYIIALIGLCLASCGEDKKVTKEDFVESFKQYEDSLKTNSTDITDTKKGVEYAEKCLEIAHKFPKDKDAPKYMDKAHMIFAGIGLHGRSVALADTIISMYPMYENRAMVLQSAATTYEMLLKENPKMPIEQRKEIEYRLEHIDLSFDELIELQQSKKPA